jgi:hypothetical protein
MPAAFLFATAIATGLISTKRVSAGDNGMAERKNVNGFIHSQTKWDRRVGAIRFSKPPASATRPQLRTLILLRFRLSSRDKIGPLLPLCYHFQTDQARGFINALPNAASIRPTASSCIPGMTWL